MPRERHHVPPAGRTPIPPGGKILNAVPPPPPRTLHTTEFRSCRTSVVCVADENANVVGYRLSVLDMLENHIYHLTFGDEQRDVLLEELGAMPRVGEPLPAGDSGAEEAH